MASAAHWDAMYDRPLEEIPWEIKQPPEELVELVEAGIIPPGKALDLACGTGNYSFYLAEKGFEVTGVDFSEKALRIARAEAKRRHLEAIFVQGDVRRLSQFLSGGFDFILEYSLLHHIAPEDLAAYGAQFNSLLVPGGKLLVVCYSEKDADAAGKSSREGKYGNAMYYRTAAETRRVYAGLHEVSYRETALGKRKQHAAHCFLFEKPAAA